MKKENNAIVMTSIIAGVVLIIAVIALFAFRPAGTGQVTQNTINVQGQGVVKAMPDLVGIYFSVETNGTTSVQSKDANAKIFTQVQDALVAAGIPKDKIATESYSVNPSYTWNNGERKDTGYKAVHSISIKMNANETDKLSRVVDAGVNAGAYVNYINFELSPTAQNKYKALAMKSAAKDAEVKANAVAQGFGKNVGRLISVDAQNFNYAPWRVYSAGATVEKTAMDTAITNIQPGEQDVSASVTATYKMN